MFGKKTLTSRCKSNNLTHLLRKKKSTEQGHVKQIEKKEIIHNSLSFKQFPLVKVKKY